MSQIKKAGDFALFFNFIVCISYILISWDGSGDISFYIPSDIPFGSGRTYTINIYSVVVIIAVIMLTLTAVLGAQVFGSGLQDSAVNFMLGVMSKTILYFVLSVFTFGILALIGTFGVMVYWIITFLFAMGLMETMFESKSGD